jgi:hypothetical protein
MIFRGLFFEHNAEIEQKGHLWMDTNYHLTGTRTVLLALLVKSRYPFF